MARFPVTPPWRESDPDPEPRLNYDGAAATWADPFADAPRWYSDKQVTAWNKAAIARNAKSHTDQRRNDDGHRRQCYVSQVPQWLLWYDGSYASLDGHDHRWYYFVIANAVPVGTGCPYDN